MYLFPCWADSEEHLDLRALLEKAVRWSYLFSCKKINQSIKQKLLEIPGRAATRAGEKLQRLAVATSPRGINASCSCWVLFHLLPLRVTALSCSCSVYTRLVISVENRIFSTFPLCTAEPHSKKGGEKNIEKRDFGHIHSIRTQRQTLKVF